MSDDYYCPLYLRALQEKSDEVARRTALEDRYERLESIAMAAAFDLGRHKAMLKEVEYAGDFCDEAACPECLCRYFKGHSKDCRLSALLADTP